MLGVTIPRQRTSATGCPPILPLQGRSPFRWRCRMRVRFRCSIPFVVVFFALSGCQESTTDVGASPMEMEAQFAIFPQYVADVRDFPDSVLARHTSPNISTSSSHIWRPSLGGSTPYKATFFPATRVVDDTTMVSRLEKWEYKNSFGSHITSYNDIMHISNYSDSLTLYYRINIIVDVDAGSISGPTNIPYKGDYQWSVSPSGGDADSTFTYQWERRDQSGGTWSTICTTRVCEQTFSSNTPAFELRTRVENSGKSDYTPVHSVSVTDPLIGPPLSVYITGPEEVAPDEECAWQAYISGGWGTISYNWWGALTGSSQTVFGELSESSWLWVEATDADLQADTASILIEVDEQYECEWRAPNPE